MEMCVHFFHLHVAHTLTNSSCMPIQIDRMIMLPMSWAAILFFNASSFLHLRGEMQRFLRLSSIKRLQMRLVSLVGDGDVGVLGWKILGLLKPIRRPNQLYDPKSHFPHTQCRS